MKWKMLAGMALAAITPPVLLATTGGSTKRTYDIAIPAALPQPAGASRLPVGTPVARSLFVDPDSEAATWVRDHPGDPRAKEIEASIATEPTGKWFGAWSGNITTAVASYVSAAYAVHRTPIAVAYDIPMRDCGGQSSGGQDDEAAYESWIRGFASGIDHRRALVVLEPDALAQITTCLNTAQQLSRDRMLSYAVTSLEAAGASVYLDAGHANWVPADEMARRLRAANVSGAAGFALNVSNYDPVQMELSYASALQHDLGMPKSFVIDTSRDGSNSATGDWCNPGGRKLGPPPQTTSSGGLLLWIKAPGESDGDCGVGSGTVAGQFSASLAQGLLAGV